MKDKTNCHASSISVSVIDPRTAKAQKIGTVSGPVFIGWKNEFTPPVDIDNSFQFQCITGTEDHDGSLTEMHKGTQQWKHAVRLSDELNDLIEEYHSPGTPRRERRSIKRQFHKVYAIFLKHCRAWHIDHTFKRT